MAEFEWLHVILAQAGGGGAAGGAPAGDPAAGMTNMLVMFGIPLLLLYFLMLRPAQKQDRERKRQIYSIKRGDEVAFAGGLLGTVVGIKEKNPGVPADTDEITIRVDNNSKLRALRSSVYQITPAEVETKEAPAAT
jgi:preprotein translocase subunit YajC